MDTAGGMTGTMINVFEVINHENRFIPSGRCLLLGRDCPLFTLWGALGTQALANGQMCLDGAMFAALVDVVTAMEVGES